MMCAYIHAKYISTHYIRRISSECLMCAEPGHEQKGKELNFYHPLKKQ